MNTTFHPSTNHSTTRPILTNLQRKILQLSVEGRTVTEISRDMAMSEDNIVKFIYILLRKFQGIDALTTLHISQIN